MPHSPEGRHFAWAASRSVADSSTLFRTDCESRECIQNAPTLATLRHGPYNTGSDESKTPPSCFVSNFPPACTPTKLHQIAAHRGSVCASRIGSTYYSSCISRYRSTGNGRTSLFSAMLLDRSRIVELPLPRQSLYPGMYRAIVFDRFALCSCRIAAIRSGPDGGANGTPTAITGRRWIRSSGCG